MIFWIALFLFVISISAIFAMVGRGFVRMVKDHEVQQKMIYDQMEVDAERAELNPEPVVEKNPKKMSPEEGFASALTLMKQGEMEEAEALFLELLRVMPDHVEARQSLGGLYMKLERYPDAEWHFSKLITLKKDPLFYSNLGSALYLQKRLTEAAVAYENAISLDSGRAARLESLAQIYHELGQRDLALKYFELASRKKPKDLSLRFLLADYYEQMGQLASALEQMEHILKEDPSFPDAKERVKALKDMVKLEEE